MAQGFDIAIFDLDGTVLDTLEDLALSVNYALTEFGLPVRRQEEVRSFLGNGMKNLIHRSMPDPDMSGLMPQPGRCLEATCVTNRIAEMRAEHIEPQVLETFLAYYKIHMDDHTAPYPGINGMLDDLRKAGVRTALVSNKGDFAVHNLIERHFPGKFDFVTGEKEGIKRKPAPDMVKLAIEALTDDPDAKVLFIGDSEVDVETSKNAGLPCAAVTWGFRSLAQLKEAGAEIFVDTTEELKNLILGGAQ
ncbi:MAG: HAD-IA family hydrolase [Eubacterium sp.]|nr:HAD-IA family hydrolase [Eubacterium sp.]